MQGQELGEIQKHSVVRVLNAGPVFVHNNHLQGGFRKAKRCGVCAKGLGGAYETLKGADAVGGSASVPEGDGADQEKDAAPTRDYGDYTPGQED